MTLQRGVRPLQFFTLAFGSIIGVAWVVVLGNWLDLAGPVGAMVGFALGGCVMMLIGLCYAELATALPVAGGEIVYAYHIFGPRLAFVVGWFLVLVYTAIAAFEAISLAWVLEAMLPGTQGPVLYSVLGAEVRVGSLAIGLAAMLLILVLNHRGARSFTRFQDLLTYTLVVAAAVFWIAGIAWGTTDNLQPLFRTGASRPAWAGVLWVFVTAPLWFAGFQVIPQVMEERARGTSLATVGRMVLWAIGMALVFYLLVILSSAMATPWEGLLAAELPVAAAMEAAFGNRFMVQIVLLAAVLGILTSWNAVVVIGSRVVFAMSRGAMIPPALSRIHPRFRSPAAAVQLIGVVAAFGVFLGRNALVPIVNIGATCLAFGFLISSWGVIRLRRVQPDLERPYRAPGGIVVPGLATAAAAFIFVYALHEPLAASGGSVPLEWVVLGTWGILGWIFWRASSQLRAAVSEPERKRLMLGALAAQRSTPPPNSSEG